MSVEERLLGMLPILPIDDLLVDSHPGRHEQGKRQQACAPRWN
jgi:hypothetical protein